MTHYNAFQRQPSWMCQQKIKGKVHATACKTTNSSENCRAQTIEGMGMMRGYKLTVVIPPVRGKDTELEKRDLADDWTNTWNNKQYKEYQTVFFRVLNQLYPNVRQPRLWPHVNQWAYGHLLYLLTHAATKTESNTVQWLLDVCTYPEEIHKLCTATT